MRAASRLQCMHTAPPYDGQERYAHAQHATLTDAAHLEELSYCRASRHSRLRCQLLQLLDAALGMNPDKKGIKLVIGAVDAQTDEPCTCPPA